MFKDLKTKYKKELTNLDNEDFLSEIVSTMFEYENIDEYISFYDIKYLEIYLLALGKCAICKKEDGSFFIGIITGGGTELDEYGNFKDVYVTTKNGEQYYYEDFRNNENIVVFYNNISHTSDLIIERYANILTEIETSLNCNLINSRYSPIASCKNSKTRTLLSKIFEEIANGKPKAIVDSDLLSSNKSIDVINVTDVENSSKIQYLAKYKDDTMRWFFSIYGMSNYASNSKSAQQTVSEVENGSNASFIIPLDRLYWRTKAIKECNKKFGWNATVKFSECWRIEFDKMKKSVNEDCEHFENNENVSRETSVEYIESGEENDI